MSQCVDVRVDGILQNYEVITSLAQLQGIQCTTVTKVLAGYRPLLDVLLSAGAHSIGEAHLQALQGWSELPQEKWMIRAPVLSEVDQVVHYSDVSLNTEAATIKALGQAAQNQDKQHNIVLMVEVGDRREGIMPEDVVGLAQLVDHTPGVNLHGLGVALGCYGGIVPSLDNLGTLVDLVEQVESHVGFELAVVSGGSSSSIHMLQEGTLPKRINHLRVGEALFTGRITDYRTPVWGGFLDPCTLSAEILEIKDKPSQPSGPRVPGEVPADADPHYLDQGVRRRALVGVGRQDTAIKHLIPVDDKLQVLHGSSDVFVADITDCETHYRVGDRLYFSLDYHGILRAMVSPFVTKNLINYGPIN
ncbi:MAG: alanine racemase [Propionibacteriaceae bacterium]|nr:alanine racemase [Propionibacteriaceae bacterium]